MATKTVELARLGDIVVEKKYGMSYEEFKTKHLMPLYPVVFGDATRDWPGRDKFTPEFFKNNYGEREVVVRGKNYKLGEFIDLMMTATEEHPAPYPCKLQIASEYPELLPDVMPRYNFAMPDRTHSKLIPTGFLGAADTLEIFFGSPGGKFPYIPITWVFMPISINCTATRNLPLFLLIKHPICILSRGIRGSRW